MEGIKIAFKTIGCRLNQFETNSIASEFKMADYDVVGFNDNADVYVVNTCTVTNQSDHSSRNYLSQASRRNKQAIVVATGCMVNNKKDWLEEQEHITYVVDNSRKSDLFSIIDGHFKGELVDLSATRTAENPSFDYLSADKSFKTRGMVKIQDGCDNFCTFCIVPFVRGRAISRPIGHILENVSELYRLGYKEIVLTGVNIGRYSFENYKFEDVVEKILDLPGDFRLRISSMEPEGIGDKFMSLVQHPKLCPHLHLCIQSGSDKILQKMRRMYSLDEYMKMIEGIRKINPLFNFTTDIIVGFPSEGDDEFIETMSIIDQVKFGHIHTFKYSKRDGTRAARMDNQVNEKLKNERSQLIRNLSDKHKLEYRKQFIGKPQRLLTEKQQRGCINGYTEYYIPFELKAEKIQKDRFYAVVGGDVVMGNEPHLVGYGN